MDLGTMVRELGTGMLITTEIFDVDAGIFPAPWNGALAFGRMARLKVLSSDQSFIFRLCAERR